MNARTVVCNAEGGFLRPDLEHGRDCAVMTGLGRGRGCENVVRWRWFLHRCGFFDACGGGGGGSEMD